MKTTSLFLTLFMIMVTSGCSTKTIYVDREVEVKVPIKCTVPDTFCSKPGSLKEGTITGLLACIADLREASKFCK